MKPELSKGRKSAIREYERDIVAARKVIAEKEAEIKDALAQIARWTGREMKDGRPWKEIKQRIIEENRPITWDEALLAASVIWKVALDPDPMYSIQRSVPLANELKVVNNLIGLSEWPDEKFQTQK